MIDFIFYSNSLPRSQLSEKIVDQGCLASGIKKKNIYSREAYVLPVPESSIKEEKYVIPSDHRAVVAIFQN